MAEITIDLATLSVDALQALANAVRGELDARTVTTPSAVFWIHPCKNSSPYHLRNHQHWAKALTAVDTTTTTSYAWQGCFLSVQAEHLVPPGSLVVWVCGGDVRVVEMTPIGSVECGRADIHAQYALIQETARRFA